MTHTPGFDLSAECSQSVKDWFELCRTNTKSAFGLARQAIEFGQSRLDEDLNALKLLMECRNFDEIGSCQKQFYESAARQYSQYFGSMTNHLSELFAFPSRDGHGAARHRAAH